MGKGVCVWLETKANSVNRWAEPSISDRPIPKAFESDGGHCSDAEPFLCSAISFLLRKRRPTFPSDSLSFSLFTQQKITKPNPKILWNLIPHCLSSSPQIHAFCWPGSLFFWLLIPCHQIKSFLCLPIMEKEENKPDIQKSGVESEDTEPVELVLFQVPECYVYIVSISTFCWWVCFKIWFWWTVFGNGMW